MGQFQMSKILDLAGFLRRSDHNTTATAAPGSIPHPSVARDARREPWIGAVRARSLCIVSGKGGTGKSVTTASLAQMFSRKGRTLLFDADLGVGNAHILQGISPKRTLADVLGGTSSLAGAVQPCEESLDLIAGGSGVARMASISSPDLAQIGDQLANLERDYSYVLADCGAGISETTLAFARASDSLLIVTTPDLTALTDAYAFLKVLGMQRRAARPMILINRATNKAEAAAAAARICDVSRRFLKLEPEWIGWLPEDRAVFESVNNRTPLITHSPNSPAAQALANLATTIQERVDAQHPRGIGRKLAAGIPSQDQIQRLSQARE
jgi:flagellar biosynthesis protein FlhG